MLVQWVGLLGEGVEFRGWVRLGGQALQLGAAFITFVLVAALGYYVAPNRKERLYFVFPGAVLTTVVWMLSKLVVGGWIRNTANYNLLSGSWGGGLALGVW